jgi:hypothetical protein
MDTPKYRTLMEALQDVPTRAKPRNGDDRHLSLLASRVRVPPRLSHSRQPAHLRHAKP